MISHRFNQRLHFPLVVFLFFSLSQNVFAEIGIPLKLKLKSPAGQYPTESGLSVRVLVLSPVTDCILREEVFSNQTMTEGSLVIPLGTGNRGVNDPNLSSTDVYNNSKSVNGLNCVDANSFVTSVGQTFTPSNDSMRKVRIIMTVAGTPISLTYDLRSTAYASQADSVGGKDAASIVVNEASTQMNQTNLNDLLFDMTRFNNLKNIAVSGQALSANTATTANSATNFTGSLAGDVTGLQGSTSVVKIRGVNVSSIAPLNGQVLTYNGTQYVPATPSPGGGAVASVAGRTGTVVLTSSDIAGLGGAALLDVGIAAGTVAAGNDSRITGALQQSTFNTAVAAANCSATQSMYWNSVSSIFACQNISFPASGVASVAGRTGSVTLSTADISGLGNAAVLNVGTAVSTVAAGDDSRIVNALQNSSSAGGDLSGTFSALTVATVGAKTSVQIASSVNETEAATTASTVSTIMKRDASGNVSVNSLNAAADLNVTGAVNGLARRVAVQNSPTTAGTVTAYTLSYGAAMDAKITTNTTGDQVRFKVHAVNSGAATLKVAGAPAASLISQFTGSALKINDLQIGFYEATFDGTNWLVDIPPRSYKSTGLNWAATTAMTITAPPVNPGDVVNCSLSTTTAVSSTTARYWTISVIVRTGFIEIVGIRTGTPPNITAVNCLVQK